MEHTVQKLMDATYNDLSLRSHLCLDRTVTFESESHTNRGITDDSVSESMEQMLIGSRPSNRLARRRRKARGKGNRADQVCIYQASGKQSIPVVAIEYKAPHMLRREEIVTGLVSEIRPDRDVINQDGKGYEFAARRLSSWQRWKGLVRSPIRTRSRCLPLQDVVQQPSLDDKDDDDDECPSPAPKPGIRRAGASTSTSTGIGSSEMQGHDGNTTSQKGTNMRPNIQNRLYCTHECLRGLVFGDPMDQKCPNLADHGMRTPTGASFSNWQAFN